MSIDSILASLDAEIRYLQQVRNLLTGLDSTTTQNARTASKPATGMRKRTMSMDARKKIVEAQRKRWAKQKAAK